MSALVKTPECRATQEALIHENNSLQLTSDCPVCASVGVRCPIGCHPSSAGMSYTSCSNLHLFPCSLIFLSPTVRPPILLQFLHLYLISHSNTIRNSLACLYAEQVMIRIGSFPPYVHVIFFTISVHEGTTKLFPVIFLDCFTFHLFAFAVLFSSPSMALIPMTL